MFRYSIDLNLEINEFSCYRVLQGRAQSVLMEMDNWHVHLQPDTCQGPDCFFYVTLDYLMFLSFSSKQEIAGMQDADVTSLERKMSPQVNISIICCVRYDSYSFGTQQEVS